MMGNANALRIDGNIMSSLFFVVVAINYFYLNAVEIVKGGLLTTELTQLKIKVNFALFF